MIEIYGGPRTSAGRCYLVLEEVGQPYRVMPLDMFRERQHKSPEYLKLNPNGRVPCLIDGDLVLWESVAITQYIADRYRPALLGRTPAERGLVAQWNFWGMLELQPPLVDLVIQTMMKAEGDRDQRVIDAAHARLPSLLRILDDALVNKSYLVGTDLTLADMNLATVFNMTNTLAIPTEAYANCTRWFTQLCDRPSFKKWLELRAQR